MNEQQLKLFISQAFALANREAKVVAALEPQLLASMKRVQDLVASLPPPGDLFRERAWRELQPRILDALGPYNQQFLNQLQTQLAEEAPQMAAEAVKMLEASGASVPAAQVRTAEAIGRGFPGLNVQDSVRVALESKVNNQRVVDLFSATPDSPVSAWMRTNQDVINKVVTRGILEGQSTEDIAKGIISTTTRNGEEYVNTQGPTATRRVLAEERAIARTAVQDANRQVNEEVFRANEEQLSGLQWEWVAALDSKTCPTCAPLDGQRWDKRSDAPEWPLHINCRCRVVAVDPETAADVRAGLQVSPTRDDLPAGREYKTKLKVKGSKLYRVSTDIKGKDGKPPTYADFLAQSNRTTQQMFFGGGNAGSIRAERFQKAVRSGTRPEVALRDLINRDANGVGRFKPVTL